MVEKKASRETSLNIFLAKCNEVTGRSVASGLWLGDESINLKLGGFDDDVHAIRDADCVVVW